MQQIKPTYQNYLALHNGFNEEHRQISKQITDLYQLPKDFMEENERAIHDCLSTRKPNDAPHHAESSYNGTRDFLFIVEDFKLQTMELFFEHRVHIDKCTIYVMKVAELKAQQKANGLSEAEMEDEFVKLIPHIDELRNGLGMLFEKAQLMASRLETIKERWRTISAQKS